MRKYGPCHVLIIIFQIIGLFVVLATGLILGVTGLICWIRKWIEDGVSIQEQLLSKVTNDTPISGFYGPGTWWAWLITLGMSHAHTGVALAMTGELPSGWDYDLVGASFYTAAAAVDLMNKARVIARLGDKASDSVLLPALACAERVMSVGTGSALCSTTVAILAAQSSGLRAARTLLGITIIPLIFALVASGFTFHARQVIAQTAPVFWCSLHDGTPPAERDNPIPFTLVDFLAHIISSNPYCSRGYWVVAAVWTALVIPIAFVGSLVHRRNLGCAVLSTILAGLASVAIGVSIPLFVTAVVTGGFGAIWVFCWVVFWWPAYIFAFFPQLAYFPASGTSVFEMDQMVALLGVVLVAVIRTLRRVKFKAPKHSAADSSPASPELAPLLPLSSPVSDQCALLKWDFLDSFTL
ncbi:hypothetical protein B0H17DRAFT_1199118 [Mycena rosella]|uniref:Uncharacterized protein n=1 Tax=Mycena rosella TaxID=1033263 RepID=A0AAD7DN80_MYCRO|nr:hypothetical protein B0H17DRAFT_1199118 [Mycena rosella]